MIHVSVDLNMCKRSLIFYSSITFLTKEFHIYSEQNYQYPFGWGGGGGVEWAFDSKHFLCLQTGELTVSTGM